MSKRLFEVFDSSQRGALDASDVLVALAVLTVGTQEQKLRLLFMMFDQDRRGYVYMRTLKEYMENIYGINDVTEDKELWMMLQRLFVGDNVPTRSHAQQHYQEPQRRQKHRIDFPCFAQVIISIFLLFE